MSDGRKYAEFRVEHARRAAKRSGRQQTADEMFHGTGVLTGASLLKNVRYISDQELADLAASSDDRTLSGRPVREAARMEIQRRKTRRE